MITTGISDPVVLTDARIRGRIFFAPVMDSLALLNPREGTTFHSARIELPRQDPSEYLQYLASRLKDRDGRSKSRKPSPGRTRRPSEYRRGRTPSRRRR